MGAIRPCKVLQAKVSYRYEPKFDQQGKPTYIATYKIAKAAARVAMSPP
jgi:hypothetical protein